MSDVGIAPPSRGPERRTRPTRWCGPVVGLCWVAGHRLMAWGDNSPNQAGAVVGIRGVGIGVLPWRHDGPRLIPRDGVTHLHEIT